MLPQSLPAHLMLDLASETTGHVPLTSTRDVTEVMKAKPDAKQRHSNMIQQLNPVTCSAPGFEVAGHRDILAGHRDTIDTVPRQTPAANS